MIKRILLSIVLLLILAYLVVAITAFNRKPAGRVCRDVELVIKDTVYAGFITKKEVAAMLEKKGISPIGKNLDRIRTKTLEQILSSSTLKHDIFSLGSNITIQIAIHESLFECRLEDREVRRCRIP